MTTAPQPPGEPQLSGEPQPPGAPMYSSPAGTLTLSTSQSKALGIVAVVLGGLALVVSVIPLFSIPLLLASVTCGIIALARHMGGKVLPIVGIVLSMLALGISITVMVIAVGIMQQQGGA